MQFSRVLVPVQGEDVDADAVRLACQVAKPPRGKVYAIYVIEVARDLPIDAETVSQTEKAQRVLDHLIRVGKEEGVDVEADLLQARQAGPALVEEAFERQADLIILGLEYKRRLGTGGLGKFTAYILANAPCKAWVCRDTMPLLGDRH